MKFIDLFAGIGGFRYGLENSNKVKSLSGGYCLRPKGSSTNIAGTRRKQKQGKHFNCVWSNEWDKYASQIYKKHYGECDTKDIRAVKSSEVPKHDLICAGFPCQSFSIAGKRKGFGDTRGTLFYEICRIARFHRTPYLFLENVKGLLNHDKGQTFSVILESLDELGYDCQWQVLNSKNFGVPQNRERVFIVGHLRGQSRPKVFPIREISKDDKGQSAIHRGNQVSRALTASYGDVSGDGTKIKVTPTLTARCNDRGFFQKQLMKQTSLIRRLTPIECERLQGFPDGWTEGISDTQRYKCLGNAVTTNVIQVIGERLKNNL